MSAAIPPRILQFVRLLLFTGIVLLVHGRHEQWLRQQRAAAVQDQLLPELQSIFPDAVAIRAPESNDRPWQVLRADGTIAGAFLKTLPAADHILGFSGPTDVLLAMDDTQRVVAARILASRDTREHVAQIREDPEFLSAFRGRDVRSPDAVRSIDAVSGATLTSFAILESVRLILSELSTEEDEDESAATSLRFPNPPRLSDVARLYPDAARVTPVDGSVHLWQVETADGRPAGRLIRTSPAADNVVGYQGPTDALLAVDDSGRIAGVAVGVSYDNEPYTDYVRDDAGFLSLFQEYRIAELARLDPAAAGIEGVSGATMTSVAVAEGLAAAAAAAVAESEASGASGTGRTAPQTPRPRRWLTVRNTSTIGITLLGIVIGLTRLRGHRSCRFGFQVLVIAWLGLINGDLVSQALFLGWVRSGLAWQQALGLTLLALAALTVPVVTGHNVYCSHICPHGAVQQLVRNRVPLRVTPGRRMRSVLKCLPTALLIWVLLLGLIPLSFSAVDIEPFNAWLFTIAGTATISVAVIGLTASLVTPMAYCRYGCPTGLLLNLVRYSRRDRPGVRDVVGVLCLAAAAAISFWL